ncbi:MAG: CPBP family intramembrane metalloprotease [Cyclobacteriaceae bacterium]|nr:CPBP family intramembrane metalloprotease [Cyclobacteriaceae bacterium]
MTEFTYDPVYITVFASVTFGYLFYWFLSKSTLLRNALSQKFSQRGVDLWQPVIQRILGLVFLGVLPVIAMVIFTDISMVELGINSKVGIETIKYTSLLAALIIPLSFLGARSDDNLAQYPQIRLKEWTKGIFFMEYFTWALYLLGYEVLFRGILLFGSLHFMTPEVAIGLNACIYAIVHIPKGVGESFGAIVLGIVLSYLTLLTGSVWIAFLVHIIMAWSNSFFSFRFQKEMKFIQ